MPPFRFGGVGWLTFGDLGGRVGPQKALLGEERWLASAYGIRHSHCRLLQRGDKRPGWLGS